ncbi:MAG: formyltetrahydrofolate deformylase [Zoogloeaceae bacterium]|jgi:formyltetrahydrofolate deformylase|nr:formyltetrahydrofolate deformylase [Zoogloeaceae bacterium]
MASASGSTPNDRENFIIKITCPATTGIVAAVTGFLAERKCYISEMAQFDDEETRRFFMRAVFHLTGEAANKAALRHEFTTVAERFRMTWDLYSSRKPMRVIIMASKHDHCLADLLYRFHKGELKMEIAAVVSNHLDLRPMTEREGIRFVYLPITKENKRAQEGELLKIVEETHAELVVLARYMQILSDELCTALSGRAINIHHSFLPGFKGARPYHQAYERGVKLIGATAHYVTSDLDEGPIIEQEVQRVDHTYSPDDLVTVGRDTETVALSRAVRYHLEHRVFLNDTRTVVFK